MSELQGGEANNDKMAHRAEQQQADAEAEAARQLVEGQTRHEEVPPEQVHENDDVAVEPPEDVEVNEPVETDKGPTDGHEDAEEEPSPDEGHMYIEGRESTIFIRPRSGVGSEEDDEDTDDEPEDTDDEAERDESEDSEDDEDNNDEEDDPATDETDVDTDSESNTHESNETDDETDGDSTGGRDGDGKGGDGTGDEDEHDEEDDEDGGEEDGKGEVGKGGKDGEDEDREERNESLDDRDVTARLQEVIAAEERLIDCQKKADELEQRYKDAIANDPDADVSNLAEDMDNAERDIISAFRKTEEFYEGIRDLTLEQRLAAIGMSDMAPRGNPVLTSNGEPISGWNFYDYRERASEPKEAAGEPILAASVPTSDLRKDLLLMGDKGDNAAYVQAELFSNWFDNVDDSDSRFLEITENPATGNLVFNYYCFAPVKDTTFEGFQHFLNPNNYDVEQRLIQGRSRESGTSNMTHGVPEDTGRGLAIIVAHTINVPPRIIERMGHGAHVRVEINSNAATPAEVRRILDEAAGIEASLPQTELSAEELLELYGDLEENGNNDNQA